MTVVLSDRSEIYQTVFATAQKKLSGGNIKLTVVDGPEAIQNTDLIVAVGVRAANALPADTAVPVLYALVPKSGYEALTKMRRQQGGNAAQSAIYLNQPVERQLRLLASALPNHRRVGILLSASSRNELDQLSREAPAHRLKVYSAEVDEHLDLSAALQRVLENSDVLLAMPDTTIYNGATIRNLLFSSYRSNKPLVGFSAGFVQAGAIGAVFSTPEQFGEQIAATIEQFSNSGRLPPPQYPQMFHVTINKTVASSLGLTLKDANVIEREIASEEQGAP